MAYAGDRLYNEHIRSMMGDLASKVRVREIIAYLPCLTISDREEIEAKRETSGNYSAMILLLDNLRRREKWPDQFISALQTCEQWALANVISEAYDRIRGIRTQRTDATVVSVSPTALPPPAPVPAVVTPISAPSPAEASATVTTATIHKVPHTSPPLLTPSVETSAQSATPSTINPFPGPNTNIDAPDTSDTLALISVPVAPVHTPPASAHPAEHQLSVLAPDARPPSSVSAPTLTPSTGQSEFPVGTKEASTLGISGGLTNTALSGKSSLAPTLPTNPISTPSQVNKPATTSQSSASPKKREVPVAVSSSVKHPIQDTNPPRIDLARDPQNNPTITQVGERVHTALLPNFQTQETSQKTAQASPSASTDAVAGCLSNFVAENEENFSKPGVLRGEEPLSVSSDLSLQISEKTAEHSPNQAARPQVMPNPHRGEEPVNASASVTLMISSSTTVSSQHVSDPVAPVQNLTPRALENGFLEGDSSSYPHQPVEDYYESLQAESGTRVHTVRFSEEPSVQNLNSQPLSMVGQTTIGSSHNGETESLVQSLSEAQPSLQISQCIQRNNASEQASPAAGLTTYVEPAPDTYQESELNASSQINVPQSEQREESHRVLDRFQSNLHLIAAAAIGMTAVFVALRLKY